MSLCKKHGKERNVICTTKPTSRGGGGAGFDYVGCEDCAAGLPPKEGATPPRKAPGQKKDTKKPAQPEKKPAPAEAIEQATKVKTIADRFGFKF